MLRAERAGNGRATLHSIPQQAAARKRQQAAAVQGFAAAKCPPDNDTLLGEFLEHVERAGLTLYPAQEAAILELYDEKNVILNTPTGSGKSLVAAALHFKSLRAGAALGLHLPDQGAGE